MASDIETIKNQIWRVIEAGKKFADEAGVLVCLSVDLWSKRTQHTHSAESFKPTYATVELLTVKEIASCLKTSEKTVRQKTKNGELPAIRIGKQNSGSEDYRYRLEDVLRELSNDPLQAPEAMQHRPKLKAVK